MKWLDLERGHMSDVPEIVVFNITTYDVCGVFKQVKNWPEPGLTSTISDKLYAYSELSGMQGPGNN